MSFSCCHAHKDTKSSVKLLQCSETFRDEGRLARLECLTVNVSPYTCFYAYFQISGKARNEETN